MNAHFKDQLESAKDPIEKATGIPNWFYTSDEAMAAEKEKVFAPNWAGIGFAKDVPEPGDVNAGQSAW